MHATVRVGVEDLEGVLVVVRNAAQDVDSDARYAQLKRFETAAEAALAAAALAAQARRLEEERERVAQARFESTLVLAEAVEADGWERVTPGDEWSRVVYLQGASEDAPSRRERYVLRFAPGEARVVDEYLSGA